MLHKVSGFLVTSKIIYVIFTYLLANIHLDFAHLSYPLPIYGGDYPAVGINGD